MSDIDYSAIASKALAGDGPESDRIPTTIDDLPTVPYLTLKTGDEVRCPDCGSTEISEFDSKHMHCFSRTADGCGAVWRKS